MIQHDPRQPGPIVHGVAKPTRTHSSRAKFAIQGVTFTCNATGRCADHETHSETGRVVKQNRQTIVYTVEWAYGPPEVIRGD